jgi:hypothetical protein
VTDEELLRQVGEIAMARQEGEIDPRWERLARGELSAPERAALLAEEGVTEGDITPLGEDFAAAMTARLLAEHPSRLRVSRRWWGAAPALLAAAAALLLWVQPDVEPVAFPAFGPPELAGGIDVVRSPGQPDATIPEFTANSPLTLTLRPQIDVPFAFACSAWFRQPSGTMVSWPCEVENISSTGAVRLSGVIGVDLSLKPGPYELVVILHSPDADGIKEQASRPVDPSAPWPMFVEPLQVVGSP